MKKHSFIGVLIFLFASSQTSVAVELADFGLSGGMELSTQVVTLPTGPVLTAPLSAADSFTALQRMTGDGDIGPGAGLSLEAQPVQIGGLVEHTANLGSFDIIINAGSTLAGNADALAAFNRAAVQWEVRIADPIIVTIDADLADMGSGSIIGSTSSVTLQAGYDTIRNQVVADAADEADDGIVAFTPTSAQFSATMPGGFGLNGNLSGSKANLKAAGFTGLDAQFGTTDATITFNTQFSFDFDNSDGVTPGTMDFETVAAHELGHALGFISVVDEIDWYVNNSSTTNVGGRILDLFRFDNDGSDDPATTAEFTSMSRSWVPGNDEITDQVLSPWGGLAAAEVRMSTGYYTGDGRQASHWKDNLGLGIMDPTLSLGEVVPIMESDFRAMDLIGYEIFMATLLGDVDSSGVIDATDIDLLYDAIDVGSTDPLFDIDEDGGAADLDDMNALIHDILDTEYGDVDLQGDVDISDYAVITGAGWQQTSGMGWADGDIDGDDDVDVTDAAIVTSHWQWLRGGGGLSGEIAGVPEPGSVVLLTIGGMVLLGCTWRRRRRS